MISWHFHPDYLLFFVYSFPLFGLSVWYNFDKFNLILNFDYSTGCSLNPSVMWLLCTDFDSSSLFIYSPHWSHLLALLGTWSLQPGQSLEFIDNLWIVPLTYIIFELDNKHSSLIQNHRIMDLVGACLIRPLNPCTIYQYIHIDYTHYFWYSTFGFSYTL